MTANLRRASSRVTKLALDAFFHHLGRTGSVTDAANRSGLRRTTLYKMRAGDEQFARRWQRALDLGIEKLQDDAMKRAMHGQPRPIIRNGQQVGTVQHFDNRLLQFLLKSHRPQIYGDRRVEAAPLPFDLAKRLAAARPRADAHEAEERARKKEMRRGKGDK